MTCPCERAVLFLEEGNKSFGSLGLCTFLLTIPCLECPSYSAGLASTRSQLYWLFNKGFPEVLPSCFLYMAPPYSPIPVFFAAPAMAEIILNLFEHQTWRLSPEPSTVHSPGSPHSLCSQSDCWIELNMLLLGVYVRMTSPFLHLRHTGRLAQVIVIIWV